MEQPPPSTEMEVEGAGGEIQPSGGLRLPSPKPDDQVEMTNMSPPEGQIKPDSTQSKPGSATEATEDQRLAGVRFSSTHPLDIAEAERQQLLPPESAFYQPPASLANGAGALPEEELVTGSTGENGRCLVARQEIPAHKLIFSEPPMVTVVSDGKESSYCNHCFQYMPAPQQCTSCQLAYFCSEGCADAHRHTLLECPVFKKVKAEYPIASVPVGYACRMMINLVQNFANTQSTEQLEKFYSFMSCISNAEHIEKSAWGVHYQKRSQITARVLEQGIATPLLQQIAMPYEGLSKMLFEIMCRIHCNAFAIKTDDGQDCGNAIFLRGAMLNHACSANCTIKPTVNSLQVLSTRRIHPGTELTIQYCPPTVSNNPRVTWLNLNYFFQCRCELCKSVLG